MGPVRRSSEGEADSFSFGSASLVLRGVQYVSRLLHEKEIRARKSCESNEIYDATRSDWLMQDECSLLAESCGLRGSNK